MDLTFDATREQLRPSATGDAVELITLQAPNVICEVCSFGATLVSVRLGGVEVAPAHRGASLPAALEASARAQNPFLGATIGRVANRTAGARVRALAPGGADLAALAANDGANTLHGGARGFDAHAWRVEWVRATGTYAAVALARTSPAGEEGFPGALEVRCVYTLAPSGGGGGGGGGRARLFIEYRARLAAGQPPDVVTPVSLTNHAYWNLAGLPDAALSPAGLPEGAALAHTLQLACSRLVPLRESDGLPPDDGSTAAVGDARGAGGAGERGAAGALDFRAGAALRGKLEALGGAGADPHKGFNAFLLVDGWAPPPSLRPLEDAEGGAALPHAPALLARLLPLGRLADPASGREMAIATTCPGVQLYTNWGFPPLAAGSTVCLETGYPPDTANTAFGLVPRSLLRAGEEVADLTEHAFRW
jgi:aldose 1-epimerase